MENSSILANALDKIDVLIEELKRNTEKSIYMCDVIAEEKNKNFLEMPCMILYDYLSKYDTYITELEEIRKCIEDINKNA